MAPTKTRSGNDQRKPLASLQAALPEVGPEESVELALLEWSASYTFEEVQSEYARLDGLHRQVLARLANVEGEIAEAVAKAESEILEQEPGEDGEYAPASAVEKTASQLKSLAPREYVLRKRRETMLLVARLKKSVALEKEREERSVKLAELVAARDDLQRSIDQEHAAQADVTTELREIAVSKHDVQAWRDLQSPKGQLMNVGGMLLAASEGQKTDNWSPARIRFGQDFG